MSRFSAPPLIGMIHLPPLPGSAGQELSPDEIIEWALADARTLRDAGFKAAIVENFGDAPFSADSLEPASVAAMAMVAARVRAETGLLLGINALRNDPRSALGIAAAAGAGFIRVNVHVGVAATDQGFITGDAAGTLRYRQRLGHGAPTTGQIAIFADVHVKHAVPVSQPDIALAAQETAYRGLADVLIVTGPATGNPADMEDILRVRKAVPDRLLYIGSGVTAETVREILSAADGVIVGSALKPGGRIEAPIAPKLAGAFVRAAAGHRHA